MPNSSDDKRSVRLPAGIVTPSQRHRGELTQIERKIAADEPPPWPVNAKLSVIGKPAPRLDGRLKVTGAARYTADVRLPGMLYARVVRSPHPHARVKSIDTSAAERAPGVRAVHVLDHLRGSASLTDPSKELQSRYPVVRYAGQPIAAVAATSPVEAEEAARLVRVDYEPLPFVVDMDEARKPGSPLVFPGPAEQGGTGGGGGGAKGVQQTGNVRGPSRSGPIGKEPGNPQKGFASAAVTVEGTFRTQVQTHSALETHGVVADWKPDGLTVHSSTQGTASVRDELAEVFELPKSRVRVVTEFMGGGFGAKFGIGNYGVLATHLSKKAGAPVKLMLDRREEHTAVGNRPDSLQRIRIGAGRDGKLSALYLEAYGTGGTGLGAGCARPAQGMYLCPNLLTEEYDVFTHAGPSAAFRAPGHPQGAFALEQAIDELAEKLRIDPLELRDRIDVDPDPEGGNADSQARRLERRIGAEKIGWSRRHPPGSDRKGGIARGIGVAQAIWYRIIDMSSACEVRILRDGSVEALSAVQDIGTGIRTSIAQVVAEELGLVPSDITVRIGDTSFPPGPGSGGSKTTGSLTPAVRNAAHRAGKAFLAQVAPALGASPDTLSFRDGKVVAGNNGHGRSVGFRQAAARLRSEQVAATAERSDDYGGWGMVRGPTSRMGIGGYGGVQFAEVAVDTETGIVRVERVVAVHDCGRPLNPLALESQINGGILQGISYALYENRVLDRGRGLMLNANFEQYKILGAREVPKIEVLLLEEYRGRNSTDAGGIGEPATVPTAAAVANAVYNAIGVRVRELPITPARVLAALAGKEAP